MENMFWKYAVVLTLKVYRTPEKLSLFGLKCVICVCIYVYIYINIDMYMLWKYTGFNGGDFWNNVIGTWIMGMGHRVEAAFTYHCDIFGLVWILNNKQLYTLLVRFFPETINDNQIP